MLVDGTTAASRPPTMPPGFEARKRIGDPNRNVCNLYSITTNQAAIIALFRVKIQIRPLGVKTGQRPQSPRPF